MAPRVICQQDSTHTAIKNDKMPVSDPCPYRIRGLTIAIENYRGCHERRKKKKIIYVQIALLLAARRLHQKKN